MGHVIELFPPKAVVRLTFEAPADVSPKPEVKMLSAVPLRALRRAASSMPAELTAASDILGAAEVGCGAGAGVLLLPPKRSPIKDMNRLLNLVGFQSRGRMVLHMGAREMDDMADDDLRLVRRYYDDCLLIGEAATELTPAEKAEVLLRILRNGGTQATTSEGALEEITLAFARAVVSKLTTYADQTPERPA